MQEMRVWSLSQEDSLKKEMATQHHILAWETPWTERTWGAPVHKGVGQDGTIEDSNAGSVPRGWLCPGPPSFGNENVRRKWRNQKNTGDVKNRHKQQHPQETLPWSCKKEGARSGPRLPLYQQDCRASCSLASQRDLVSPGPAGQHLGFDFQFDFHAHK